MSISFGPDLAPNGKRWAPVGVLFAQSPFTTKSNDVALCDSTAGAITVRLPASPALGDAVFVGDEVGAGATHNLTVNGNGHTIDGAATFVISNDGGFAIFLYDGTMWVRVVRVQQLSAVVPPLPGPIQYIKAALLAGSVDVAAEAAARAAADTALATAITTEATARAGADTTLQTNLDAEAAARAAGDAALTAAILTGAVDLAMVDADYAPSGPELGHYTLVKTAGVAFGADRTLTLPNVGDAAATVHYIENRNGAAHDLIVTNVAGGTNVHIANGKGAIVGNRATGCYRITADSTVTP